MQKCEKCGGSFYTRGDNDLWIPCECLLLKRMEQLKLGREFNSEVSVEDFDEDLLIVSQDLDRARDNANAVIWNQLKRDIDLEVSYTYSGDMASSFLSRGKGESFLRDFEDPDILFIYIVTGEAYGKLTGVVVNQVWEFRKTEGLITHFIAPYGGPKLFRRYPAEESPLGEKLKKLRVMSVV